MKYSSSFAGFILNNKDGQSLVRSVRNAIKGKNVVLRIFARNKNRKQHAKNRVERNRFRQHLPVKYATHFGVYIYNDHKKPVKCSPEDIIYAKATFDVMSKIYVGFGGKVSP